MGNIVLIKKNDVELRFKTILADYLNALPYDNVKIEINANKKINNCKIKVSQFFDM